MSEYIGKKLKIEIFGTSHGEVIGGKVKGFPSFTYSEKALKSFTDLRKPIKNIGTKRVESDTPTFKGIRKNKIKNKFSFTIENKNVIKKDYSYLFGKPRPSHADYAFYLKDGALDFSGGNRFSGRLTAPLCVIGGICKQYLEKQGIKIFAYAKQTGKIIGSSYNGLGLNYNGLLKLRKNKYPSLDKKAEMIKEILSAKKEGDSVGGKIECVIFNMKKGIGDNLFSGLEGKISSLIYAIPAVKGVEFGLGFGFCDKKASIVNDGLCYNKSKIELISNNNGGINGGISNGAPITIGVGIKPTPSIEKEQNTVDLITKKNTTIKIKGRHDACIVPRIIPCVESAVAIAILDELLGAK